jgi:hypothetical protein
VFFVVVGGEKMTLIVHVPPGTRVVVPVVLQVPVVNA